MVYIVLKPFTIKDRDLYASMVTNKVKESYEINLTTKFVNVFL